MLKNNLYLLITFVIIFANNNVIASDNDTKEFIHGITFKVDDQQYNITGAPDGPNGEQDIPGHYWLQTDKNNFVGQHYNTGPFGAEKWWSSDTDNAALLWVLEAKLDIWSQVKAIKYFSRGFVGYQPIINVTTGKLHPKKVLWLKHVSIRNFTFDGLEPLAFAGQKPHKVIKGIDFNMDINWNVEYPTAVNGEISLSIKKN